MNKQKKVWIITRRAGYNFGSSLQAYAMQQIIRKSGFENKIIDYDEYHHSIRWRIRPFIENCIYRLMQLIPNVSAIIARDEYKRLYYRNFQREKFTSFEKEYLQLTSKRYKTSKAIAKDASDCDICICGSDQIWSPLLFDPAMFLDFCDSRRTKTLAYAPSFGVSVIETHKTEIKVLINRIQNLTIREETGAKIIKDLTNREVLVALDPTLLISRKDWEGIAIKPEIHDPYILCFFLGNSKIPHIFLDSIKHKTNYKVITIQMYYNLNSIQGENIYGVSPQEFLGLIANASFVCTDSYHGTIFSIIFEKQFFTFKRFSDVEFENQNSRIDTLLINNSLSDRLIPSDSLYDSKVQFIDYNIVKPVIQKNIQNSFEYLQQILSNK